MCEYTMDYYCKGRILPFTTTWINLEDIMLNEISQAEKEKHHLIYVVCKKEKNQIHRNRE